MSAKLKFAAWMMYGSAGLHLIAPFVIGLTGGAFTLALIGVAWAVMAWALATYGWRSLAWLSFVLALGGMCVALSQPWGAPAWMANGFALFDGLAALGLFGALWRAPEQEAVA